MSKPKMTGKDVEDATGALFDWFQSQQIGPSEAVLVMIAAISGILHASTANPKQRREGGTMIADMLLEALTK